MTTKTFVALTLIIGTALLSGSGCGALRLKPEMPAAPEINRASDFDFKQIKTIAVLPLGDAPEKDPGTSTTGRKRSERVPLLKFPIPREKTGDLLQKNLENALVGTRYHVIERTRLKALLEEQHFQQTDLADTSAIVQIGRLAGADAVIFGDVDKCHLKLLKRWDKPTGLLSKRVPVTAYLPQVSISIKMVDVESGRILWTCSHKGTGRRFLDSALTVTKHEAFRNPHSFAAPLGTVEELARLVAKECIEALARDTGGGA